MLDKQTKRANYIRYARQANKTSKLDNLYYIDT